jgi:hypothetical protein
MEKWNGEILEKWEKMSFGIKSKMIFIKIEKRVWNSHGRTCRGLINQTLTFQYIELFYWGLSLNPMRDCRGYRKFLL